MRHTLLREAIRRVLGAPVGFTGAPGSPARMTAMAALGLLSGQAIAQDAPQDQNSNQQLETITVTGSNIRRVDIETSNPVITIDRAAIQKTGKLTLGDLVQQLPAVTGPNTNPQINNGGGIGRVVDRPARPRFAAHAGADQRPSLSSPAIRTRSRRT